MGDASDDPFALIVDDDEDILGEMLDALDDLGVRCIGAMSMGGALDAIRATPSIVIVVTDIRMPGGSGIDLAHRAAEEGLDHLQFIFVTGHGSLDADPFLKGPQTLGLFKKPIDIDALFEVVDTALRNRGITPKA